MTLQMCLGFTQGDYDKASDLSQEVFIKVWKHLDSFKGLSSYKTWIYRITVNTCLQLIQKEKKNKTLPIDNSHLQFIEESKNDSTEASKQLYKAIGQLNELDRLVIMMVLEGQQHEDIAEVLGIQPTNIRVKIHRIKKRLKKILEHE
ncbi:MAG: RNA polymerase sigma factor [Flavobacteriaceae bacterium]|nr:RNA polymerase sigma factor [Flavobacteriaceae bacterium]